MILPPDGISTQNGVEGAPPLDPVKQARLRENRLQYSKHLNQSLLKPNGPVTPVPRHLMAMGRRLRDEMIWQYPILPGAIQIFQDLASTREWVVSGQPRAAARSVEWLNNAESINPFTGLKDYGYDSYLKRRVLDYLLVGMTTMASSTDLGEIENPPLEYIDPTLLIFRREKRRVRNGFVDPVRPEEKVWLYGGTREIRSQDLWHHYPIPIGAYQFSAPVLYLLPSAVLAWLIRESDTASVDGRQIRDILLLDNPAMFDAIEQGILTNLALWNGANPEEVGIPIIPLHNTGSKPVRDLFARLGFSQIPDSLDRNWYFFYFVNEVAAALGLALRHFWNDERTTNRALEVVQEQRQQQKGPATFVRTEQRLLNRSGFLNRFGTPRSRPRFGFIEETDIASMKDRAEALKNIAEAFGQITDRLGARIALESLVAWLQIEDVLPNDIRLIEAEMPADRINPDETLQGEGDQTKPSDPEPTAAPMSDATPATKNWDQPFAEGEDLEKHLDDGEIVMSGTGRILARHHKIYSLADYLESRTQKLAQESKAMQEAESLVDAAIGELEKNLATEFVPQSELMATLSPTILAGEEYTIRLVRKLVQNGWTDSWKTDQYVFKDHDLVDRALLHCQQAVELSDDERMVIDMVALDWEALET